MRITFRTYSDEIRAHRMMVNEIISSIARLMMRNSRKHDIALTTAPCKDRMEQAFSEFKDSAWYSPKWYDIVMEKCPVEYDQYVKSGDYQIDKEEGRKIENMDLCQLMELTADIVSHARLQQESPYVILTGYLNHHGISMDSTIASILNNTIKTMQRNDK